MERLFINLAHLLSEFTGSEQASPRRPMSEAKPVTLEGYTEIITYCEFTTPLQQRTDYKDPDT